MKAVALLASVRADDETHGKRRPVLVRHERAEIVGDFLRQHRHDAVGKIDGIATDDGLAIERAAGPDIEGHVGDGDADDEAALVLGVRVALREDRVVMVFRIRRIDRNERDVPPVLSRKSFGLQGGRLRGGGLRKRVGAEGVRNAMRMQRDQADGLFAGHRADDFAHASLRRAEPRTGQHFHGDEIAVFRLAAIGLGDGEFAPDLFLVDGLDIGAARADAKNPERPRFRAAENLDDTRAILRPVFVRLLQTLGAREHAIADAGRRVAGFRLARTMQEDAGQGTELRLVPFDGRGDEFAVGVEPHDIGKDDGRQRAADCQRLAPPLDAAGILQFAEDALQFDFVAAGNAKGARDFAFSDFCAPPGLTLARDEGEDVLAGGRSGHDQPRQSPRSCAA